jgi:adenine-specific DNA-methyltransferase
VLKILQKHYHGKIKMIYIDPPYNTGSDFVYPDNYQEGLENYLEWTRQVNEDGKKISTNSESEGRYHSNWLSMMYPRLKFARNLLRDDGLIAVHIDENEYSNLEKLLNEIFGESNNLGTVIWDKRNPKGEVRGVAHQHESILFFSRNIEVFAKADYFFRQKENAEAMVRKALDLFKKSDPDRIKAQGEYQKWLASKAKSLSGGEAAYRFIDDNGDAYRPVSMAAPDKPETRSHRPLIHSVTQKPCPVPEKGWRYPDISMDALLASNQVLFGVDETTQPQRKYLLKENLTERVPSLLYFGGSDDAVGLPFDNPKPLYVAKRIIGSICQDSDIVLDFFAGSSTTAHAVMELNLEDGGTRNFIMVQLPEPTNEKSLARKQGYETISELSRERIVRAADSISQKLEGDGLPPDLGFRSFKLSDSLFAKWRAESEIEMTALEQHLFSLRGTAADEASPHDLLAEVLLKLGFSLTESISQFTIDGLPVLSVGDGVVLAYLDERVKPSLDTLRSILDPAPTRFIILEDSFHGDDELKTNLAQLCKSKNIELWTA